jgi:hypothetical protein
MGRSRACAAAFHAAARTAWRQAAANRSAGFGIGFEFVKARRKMRPFASPRLNVVSRIEFST